MNPIKLLKKYTLTIDQKFNKKKKLEITVKNNSNILFKNFKICFSTIYSIDSIKNATIKNQVARYYETFPLLKEELKPKSSYKFELYLFH